ncbi:MAG: hypothetical protein ACYC0V_12435 [Armatimonadota bacterium]
MKNIRDILGSCHFFGNYSLRGTDLLNDGADNLLELGSRAIKVAFRGDAMQGYYSVNSEWPVVDNMVDLAKTPYFKNLFSKPFSVIALMAYSPGKEIFYFLKGMTAADIEWEYRMVYDLTVYLLTEYKGSGKTFIYTNWEGDWTLTPPMTPTTPIPSKKPDAVGIKGMIDWLNTRQNAVDQARKDVGMDGVIVAHAAEVNLIDRAMKGESTATNEVVPYTHCDLYSYSAWDTLCGDKERFVPALDYLALKAPDSELYGHKNVYIGEFGAPISDYGIDGQLEITQYAVESALDWGVQYAFYWVVYDENYGLFLPDGSKTPACKYIEGKLNV